MSGRLDGSGRADPDRGKLASAERFHLRFVFLVETLQSFVNRNQHPLLFQVCMEETERPKFGAEDYDQTSLFSPWTCEVDSSHPSSMRAQVSLNPVWVKVVDRLGN